MSWFSIKPDQGAYSAFLEKLQVKDVHVVELHSTLPGYLNLVRPIYGLILFSEWHTEEEDGRAISDPIPNLIFRKEPNNNASAFNAIFSILMNTPLENIGPEIKMLKKVTRETIDVMRHEFNKSYEAIRKAHNSCARTEEQQKVYTFVSYLLVDEVLYELNGLQGRISHGPCQGTKKDQDWLNMVHPIIREQMDKYSERGIRFWLMGVVKNGPVKLVSYETQLDELKKKLDDLQGQHLSILKVWRAKREVVYRIAHVELKLQLLRNRLTKWMMANIKLKFDYMDIKPDFH